MTTADYLTQLVKDVETVRTNLNERGVVTDPTETLTTLAPKINDIGEDLETVVYMKLFDLLELFDSDRPIKESYYTKTEVDKVESLLNFLGGGLDG